MKLKYAIVDIETTGDKPINFKIIEIAIIIQVGVNELYRYHTFVDPQEKISPIISRLTGIKDSDVFGAPKYFEIVTSSRYFIFLFAWREMQQQLPQEN